VLDGALAGGVAGLLVVRDGAFRALLLAGDPPSTTAVALEGWPAEDSPPGIPVGRIASYGDRFLVAYGMLEPSKLLLRLRALLPDARLLPVNAPGAPGADGSPALELPLTGEPRPPTLLLDPYAAGVLLAAALPGVPAADGGETTPDAAWVVRTPTGAPANEDALGFRLRATAASGAVPLWQIDATTGTAPAARYVGALGAGALAVDDGNGAIVRVPAASGPDGFRFEDGWLPSAGERVWSAPDHLGRLVPGEGVDASSPVQVVIYGPHGNIVSRIELSPGVRPLAIARTVGQLLLVDAAGAVSGCGTAIPPRMPRILDVDAALENPGAGRGQCGR
jgi:hypothetical protein